MANTTYNSTQDIITKLQRLKGKTKFIIYNKISNYYDEMNKRHSGNFQFEEDPFSKGAQSIGSFCH